MIHVLLALVLMGPEQQAGATPSRPPAPAQAGSRGWLAGPFSLYVENDSLPLAGGDESYTQGLELHLTLRKAVWPAMHRAVRKLGGKREFEDPSSVFIGQTIFTPQNIITYIPRRDDRPFVGYLYAGLSSVLISPDWGEDEEEKTLRPRRITAQLVAGVTGDDMGLAHSTQAAFHVLRESRIPKGWHTQNGNRPEVSALLMREDVFAPFGHRKNIDFTTVGTIGAGTVQTFASAGGILRIGWNLKSLPANTIAFSAEKSDPKRLEIAAFAGAEAKALALNRFADQGGEGRPDLRHFVYEWRIGAMARLKNGLSVSYMVRRRSQEIEPLPPGLRARHWIGSLQVAKSLSDPPECDCLAFLKGVRVNFGLGRGHGTVEPDVPAEHDLELAGHWGLEKSLLANRFAVAIETSGIAREWGPGSAPSGHRDTFLFAKAATFGVELLPNLQGRHRLQLRAGGGLSLVKTETTPSEGGIDEPELLEPLSETGSSALAGLRYTLRVGKPASLALNVAYSHLFLDGKEAGVRRAGFWTATLGVQLHFWGRDREPSW